MKPFCSHQASQIFEAAHYRGGGGGRGGISSSPSNGGIGRRHVAVHPICPLIAILQPPIQRSVQSTGRARPLDGDLVVAAEAWCVVAAEAVQRAARQANHSTGPANSFSADRRAARNAARPCGGSAGRPRPSMLKRGSLDVEGKILDCSSAHKFRWMNYGVGYRVSLRSWT